jgi:transposase
MKAYSTDLRTKILAALDDGLTQVEAARLFRVGLATIKRYVALRRGHHSLEPKPRPGRPRAIPREHEEALRALVEADPAAYLDEYRDRWAEESGVRVSISTMSRALRKLGFTRKKGRWVPPSGTRASARSGIGS